MSFKKPTNCLWNSEIHSNLNWIFPAENYFPWSQLDKQFLDVLRQNMLLSCLCVYCTGCFWMASQVPCSAVSSVHIVHKIALNTVVRKITHTNVLGSTKQTDFKNKVIGITTKEKSPRKCLQSGPFLEPLCPGVVYQLDTACRCGECPCWQAKEGSGSGLKNCSLSHHSSRHHYTQPGTKATNIKDSQLVHCPHPEKPAEVFMRKAAGLPRTVCSYNKLCFKVSSNYYLYVFVFIAHFQKKAGQFRNNFSLDLKNTTKSSFWQHSTTEVYRCRRVGLISTSLKWSQICRFVKMESGKQIFLLLYFVRS